MIFKIDIEKIFIVKLILEEFSCRDIERNGYIDI